MRGMFRPIPRAALPGTMTVRAPLADGTYGEPELICYVRFERAQRASDDDHRSADAGGGTVYVDAFNSVGAFEVQAGSRVAVAGRSMYATEVRRCEDLLGRVHHWEIEVR